MKYFVTLLLGIMCSVALMAQTDFEKGKSAFTRGAYDEAIPLFQKFLSENARNVEANFYLGESYRLKGDVQNAQEVFEKTLDYDDEYEPALASIIRVYGKLGLWAKAQKSYTDAMKYHKTSISVPLAFAQTYLDADSVDKASIYFSKIKEIDGKNVDAYVGLSEVYARQNVIVLAVDNMRTATQLDSTNPVLWYKLALAILKNRSLNADQIREVTSALQKSIELDPTNDKAIFDAGNLFFRLNKPEFYREAAGFFKRYVELKKDNPEAWEKFGISAFKANAFSDATDALVQAIKMNPKNFDLKPMLANSYYYLQEYKNSIDAFKTIPSDSLGKDDFYKIGVSYFRLKDTVGAIKSFTIANAKDTSANIAAGDLAAIYINQRKYDLAIVEYEKLLNREPENITALFYAGYSAFVLARYPVAEIYFQKFLKLKPTNIQAHSLLGQVYTQTESYDPAEEQFKDVVLLSDSSAKAEPAKSAQHIQSMISAYRSLALIDYKRKNYQEAVNNLLKAIDREPKNKPEEGTHLFLAQMYAVQSGDATITVEAAQAVKKKACDEYKLVLKINPRNPSAKKESEQMGCPK
jgi:tetratricopeptide (TPR) repeat protein